jgi:hypothetical protein
VFKSGHGQLDGRQCRLFPAQSLGNDIAKNSNSAGRDFQLAWSEGILVPEIRVAVLG